MRQDARRHARALHPRRRGRDARSGGPLRARFARGARAGVEMGEVSANPTAYDGSFRRARAPLGRRRARVLPVARPGCEHGHRRRVCCGGSPRGGSSPRPRRRIRARRSASGGGGGGAAAPTGRARGEAQPHSRAPPRGGGWPARGAGDGGGGLGRRRRRPPPARCVAAEPALALDGLAASSRFRRSARLAHRRFVDVALFSWAGGGGIGRDCERQRRRHRR
mmetsp:Transcript_25868/g.85116  ORF Transcript_25868/g.85116 Transcript_25868/m.85116 type:complete len:222 (-) Transcript_25868:12-677(-)